MELRFFLKSKTPSRPEGTVSMKFFPVEGAKENEEFIGSPTGEICLDSVSEESVKEYTVPSEEERTGVRIDEKFGNVDQGYRVPTGKPLVPYQEFLVNIVRAPFGTPQSETSP